MKAKRTKKYAGPRVPNIPMMGTTHNELAMGLHAAIETLIAAPDVDNYNDLSLRFITLGRVVGPQSYMEQAKSAMLDIAARFERVGKFGVNAVEAAALRLASGQMDMALPKIPVNKLWAAEMRTVAMLKGSGVQS